MGLKERGAITGIGETAVAAVPGPAGVRVWEIMSRGWAHKRGDRWRRVLVLPTLIASSPRSAV
jgi:hypothetical protein